MKKTEAKELTIKYIDSFFNEFGFKLIKTKNSNVQYERKVATGFEYFGSGTLDYTPIQIIRYAIFKRIDAVEEISAKLGEKIKLSPPINGETNTIAFSYESLNGINKQTTLPDMKTEEDLISCVETIKTFMRETAIPLLDRFNDLREIDKEINGEQPWETDWKQKFNLGGNFNHKRLIIAKLANNPNYDNLIDTIFTRYEKMFEKDQEKFPGRDNLDWPIAYTVNFLKDISPLYDSYID